MLIKVTLKDYGKAFNEACSKMEFLKMIPESMPKEVKAQFYEYWSMYSAKNNAVDRAAEILEEHRRLVKSQSAEKKVIAEEHQIEVFCQELQSKLDKMTDSQEKAGDGHSPDRP